jgi:imidazolonepropionase
MHTDTGVVMNAAQYPSADGLWHGIRLAADPVIKDAAIAVRESRIAWVGRAAEVPAMFMQGPRHDGGGALVTPGLVDCHTHLVYGGLRANEFAMRLAGASYEDLAKAGGGIIASVRATRAASEDALFDSASARLANLLADGVCAIEIKSGYGLALEHERKQLRVARRLGAAHGVIVRTTFLGAHALPPEYAGRSSDYIDLVCSEMLPALAAEGLVDAVDVFCERIAFSLEETERVFKAAKALGLPVKLHAEQLSDMGGLSWRRVMAPSRAIMSSTCPRPASRPCVRRARSRCCCPAPTMRYVTRIRRRSRRCAPRACRWRYRRTTTLAPRQR